MKSKTKTKIKLYLAFVSPPSSFIFAILIQHLICASFELIEQVRVAKLCCVEDQGRASHCVVEPGEDIDRGDEKDCDGKDVVDKGDD